uniref:Uncharacterized protein n=1 Tax=Chromera velia CCMP2878 TaxID=1169474 RepID=A0A0G4HRU0_9ALVE|eukprot:Cvel_8144.t1-p1 / transcript=Cvel_8144.t1 / gene=Cvel_8144 / organism=Chromera_velia_CCMP2878 / gene_product=hypothetical protein / transcript_product=hypothetical protein / location=Cvel_scaffold443:33491-35973(-) / protein_length=208 / sequence_SO=supercontig / SO=protein_coding / is_pseudo=false
MQASDPDLLRRDLHHHQAQKELYCMTSDIQKTIDQVRRASGPSYRPPWIRLQSASGGAVHGKRESSGTGAAGFKQRSTAAENRFVGAAEEGPFCEPFCQDVERSPARVTHSPSASPGAPSGSRNVGSYETGSPWSSRGSSSREVRTTGGVRSGGEVLEVRLAVKKETGSQHVKAKHGEGRKRGREQRQHPHGGDRRGKSSSWLVEVIW